MCAAAAPNRYRNVEEEGESRTTDRERYERTDRLAFYLVLADGRVYDGGGVCQLGEEPLFRAGSAPAAAAPTRGHAAPAPGVGVVMVVGMGN